MTYSTAMIEHPYWADFNCYYKVDNGCTFGDHAKAILFTRAQYTHVALRSEGGGD